LGQLTLPPAAVGAESGAAFACWRCGGVNVGPSDCPYILEGHDLESLSTVSCEYMGDVQVRVLVDDHVFRVSRRAIVISIARTLPLPEIHDTHVALPSRGAALLRAQGGVKIIRTVRVSNAEHGHLQGRLGAQ
jgi:hypothetical protein